jgi:hypothetical protein
MYLHGRSRSVINYIFGAFCAAMARSFLQVAATEEVAPPLRAVQIEGLVLFHI